MTEPLCASVLQPRFFGPLSPGERLIQSAVMAYGVPKVFLHNPGVRAGGQ
jgi:hypothetical protein